MHLSEELGPVLGFRLRLISVVLALVSIGLLASLLPRTSYVSQTSGELVDAIGPVWPDSAVEQAFGDVPGIISEVRIWAAAGFDRGDAVVDASLLQRRGGEPVRQVKVQILASKLLRPYVLVFPPYQPVPGEDLILQLWVSTERKNHVMFGVSEPREDIESPAINRQSVDQGPLRYEVIWRGWGWRAALAGSGPHLARLIGAAAAAGLAAVLHPSISRPLRWAVKPALTAILAVLAPVRRALRRAQARRRPEQKLETRAPSKLQGIFLFPWLIPTFAILHYFANNLFIFRLSEALVVSIFAGLIVAGVLVVLRLVMKDIAVAAVLTGLVGVAFFSYGHVSALLGDRGDDAYLFALMVPTVIALGGLASVRARKAYMFGRYLNYASLVLVAIPLFQISIYFITASPTPRSQASQTELVSKDQLAGAKSKISSPEMRDVYYIILDAYPRSGSPEFFDNSGFVKELESRGFYVAPQAQSNYGRSIQSIPSSLNMKYLDEFADQFFGEEKRGPLYEIADDHTLGRILKGLGYKYVHVASGWFLTDTSRLADLVVDFTPSGRIYPGSIKEDRFSLKWHLPWSGSFLTTFLRTTAAKPFLSHQFSAQDTEPYDFTHPYRTLAWFEFMREVARIEGPKFVFAHLLKPHGPFSFDKHGAITTDLAGWTSEHDPTVRSPFYGQVIYLNSRILEIVDAILEKSERQPIMVIAGDHGYETAVRNDILAAYLLPGDGDSALYPSITSVNSFRAILDYYFGLDMGLLEDRIYRYDR